MTDLKPKKIGENQYQIDADSSLGMKVPVTTVSYTHLTLPTILRV